MPPLKAGSSHGFPSIGLASRLEQRDFHPPVYLSSLRSCIVGQGFCFAQARNGDATDINGVLSHKIMSGRFGTTTPEAQVRLSAASVIRMSRYGCLELRTLAHSSSDLAQSAYLNRTELELFDLGVIYYSAEKRHASAL